MNVVTKTPIRISVTESIPAGTVKPKEFFGSSADYLLERGCLAVHVQPPRPEPAPEPQKPEVKPGNVGPFSQKGSR